MPRIFFWRFFIVIFLICGLISYQFDLYNGVFSDALSLFGSTNCLEKSDSYVILGNISKNSRDGCNGSGTNKECKSILAITSAQLGGKYMGLGNQMFVYASLLGIGKIIGADFIVGCTKMPKLEILTEFEILKLNKTRKLSIIVGMENLEVQIINSTTRRCCAFVDVRGELSGSADYDLVTINGYLQSFKYFDRFWPDIDKLFTFKRSIVEQAAAEFREIIDNKIDQYRSIDLKIGCVHVRRGDILSNAGTNRGYIHGDQKTIRAAIRHLQRVLAGGKFRILLFSDDFEWCYREFGGFDKSVLIARNRSPASAMQMMTQYCDKLLLTSSTSTFGWWAAYLNKRGAKIYYNAQVLRSGSGLESEMVNEDYFLPGWTPVDLGDKA